MKPYLIKMPNWIDWFYRDQIWRFSSPKKTLYLTFDDGPTPDITPFVLEQLAHFNAKATFFCIGKNITANQALFEEIKTAGHSLGNHTFSHVKGSKTSLKTYLYEVEKTAALMPETSLFRPPYGRIKRMQTKALKKRGFNVIMWSVLSADFDLSTKPEICYRNVVNNAKSGDIIVFHDSLKAAEKIRYALPKVLAYFQEKGYTFNRIPQN
ncbi:polysaccharide deacetylase family protein [Flavobacteriaceae bacterium F08102]|nr:polysaccharide deacetylase family protein [Flavobacteriaceae bacterium F08102]